MNVSVGSKLPCEARRAARMPYGEYEDSASVHIALAKWDFATASRAMSDTQRANGIDHVFNEIPGGHDWEFWQLMFAEFLQDYLWAERDFSS